MTAQPMDYEVPRTSDDQSVADVIALPVAAERIPLEQIFVEPKYAEVDKQLPQAVNLGRLTLEKVGIGIDELYPGAETTDMTSELLDTFEQHQAVIVATLPAMKTDEGLRNAVEQMYEDTDQFDTHPVIVALDAARQRLRVNVHTGFESPELNRWRLADRLIRLQILAFASQHQTVDS